MPKKYNINPVKGFDLTETGTSGVTNHGSLTGLSEDDHTQYLLADGTRALTNDMAVTDLKTVDGRDLSVDGSKLDGVETGAEVNNISDVNATDLTDGGDTTLHTHASVNSNFILQRSWFGV